MVTMNRLVLPSRLSAAYAWTGWVPFDAMPAARDPEEGLLVSANNRPSAGTEPYIAHDFAGPARATRILELLREWSIVIPLTQGRLVEALDSP